MARIVAEYLLMRFFFPELKDRKRMKFVKANFDLDMRFNLSTGKVEPACQEYLQRPKVLQALIDIYEKPLGAPLDSVDQHTLIELMNQMPWSKGLQHFINPNKVQLMRQFTLKKLGPGSRISAWQLDYIDSYNIILKGSVGIFYPDMARIRDIGNSNIVCCNESEAERLRNKQNEMRKDKQNKNKQRNETLEALTHLGTLQSRTRQTEDAFAQTFQLSKLLTLSHDIENKGEIREIMLKRLQTQADNEHPVKLDSEFSKTKIIQHKVYEPRLR